MINFNKSQKRAEVLIEGLKRRREQKNEIKKKILKAIIKNQNQRLRSFFKNLYKNCGKTTFNKQQNRCLYTGRIRGFQKKTWSSRQALKKFAVFGTVQNLKKKSW